MTARATDDWDGHYGDHAEMNTRNPAVAFRRDLVLKLLALDEAGGPVRILELGSGIGLLARDVLARHPSVEFVGLDVSEAGVVRASKNVPAARFFHQDLTLPLKIPDTYRGWATHVVCSEVLEHLDDPVAVLRGVRPLLARGARVIVTVPAGPISAFARSIGHRRHYTRALLDSTLHDAGLKVRSTYGAGFPFYNLYLLATVARGKKLIEDAGHQGKPPTLAARVAMAMFAPLFRLNVHRTGLGWQIAAIANEPG